MKTKQKLVLSLAALSAITLGVGATSTFAWFTTTRTATVAVNNVGVYGTTGSLRIGYFAIDNGNKGSAYTEDQESALTTANGSDKTSIVLTSTTNMITPISGDGSRFFSPTWLLGKEGSQSAHDAKYISGNTTTEAYMVQFGIFFSNTGSTKPLNVFFDYGTGITPTSTGKAADIAAAKASRVSFTVIGATRPTSRSLARDLSDDTYLDTSNNKFYTSDGTTWTEKTENVTTVTTSPAANAAGIEGAIQINSTDKTVWSCTATDTWKQLYPTSSGAGTPTAVTTTAPSKYLVAANTTDSSSGQTYDYMDEASDYTEEGTPDLASIAADKVITDEIPAAKLAVQPATTSKTLLCTITPDSFEYIGVSLWIEGASDDCTNTANKGSIELDLAFAAF